ncbi:MAG: CGNR zinc finger domain-containing protein [Acidimicrobiales bacterium]
MNKPTTPARLPVPVMIALANARRSRRAPRARDGRVEDPFAALGRAREFLAPLRPAATVTPSDLHFLAQLADEVSDLATALVQGAKLPQPRVLNALAAQAGGHRQLRVVEQSLEVTTHCQQASVAAELARRAIDELGGLDPARLRECARDSCKLVFYDLTRSNTQRWHAEDPCGWYQRQVRHRSVGPRPTGSHP